MQLQPVMRKRVNILFVALATSSVVYGMILKYSPENDNAIIQTETTPVSEEVVNFSDGVVDLDALELGNPD